MITQREISQLAHREQISERVVEKDYVITWLLLALADSKLKDSLAFKGGTAIKKIYFPDYRYSEDLDFTVLENKTYDDLVSGFKGMLVMLSKAQGFEFAIPEGPIEGRNDSLTFYINFVGPLQARLNSRNIKVDFTLSEKVIFPLEDREVHSVFSDKETGKLIKVYSLEEILTEKLCAIIGRTEPRDIYDAEYLFSLNDIDIPSLAEAFREKAEFKGIDCSRLNDVLNTREATFSKMWETRLRHQVKDLPPFDETLRRLKRSIRQM